MLPETEFFNLYNHDFARIAVGVPEIRVADIDVAEGGKGVFRVTLSEVSDQDIRVKFATSDRTEQVRLGSISCRSISTQTSRGISTCPRSGASRPEAICKSVVLPAPLGPTSPIRSSR